MMRAEEAMALKAQREEPVAKGVCMVKGACKEVGVSFYIIYDIFLVYYVFKNKVVV